MAKKIGKYEYFEHLENTLGQEASSIRPEVEPTMLSTESITAKSITDAALEKLLGTRPTTAYGRDITSLGTATIPVRHIEESYDDILEELGHHLKNINDKLDNLTNEKSDLLTVLKDIGMHLTILYNRGVETPCIAFEGVSVHIKLTIEQYAKLVSLGVPVV